MRRGDVDDASELRVFMPATAARMAWKAADRLMAMMAFHLSIGKVSIASTCWMPALLTSTSTAAERLARVPSTMRAMSSGRDMSAAE